MTSPTDENAWSSEELRLGLRYHAVRAETEAGNVFFNQFIYHQYLIEGRFSECVNSGIQLLLLCKSLDPASYDKIHKGSAYYWIGMAACLMNDFQAATYFFDAAVSEDLRAGYHPLTRSTPSFKFLLAQSDNPAQAARDLTKALANRFEFGINDYVQRPGISAQNQTFDIDQLRDRLIAPSLIRGREKYRTMVTALVSFALEWHYLNALMEVRPVTGTSEPFFVHLFKGCVLIESLAKLNPKFVPPTQHRSLVSVLQFLQHQLGIPNDLPTSSQGLSDVLLYVSRASTSIADSIIISGKLRNTIGHNIGWDVQITNAEYNQLVMRLFSSMFHLISSLY